MEMAGIAAGAAPWTDREDDAIRKAVERYDDKGLPVDWDKISKIVFSDARTVAAIKTRWWKLRKRDGFGSSDNKDTKKRKSHDSDDSESGTHEKRRHKSTHQDYDEHRVIDNLHSKTSREKADFLLDIVEREKPGEADEDWERISIQHFDGKKTGEKLRRKWNKLQRNLRIDSGFHEEYKHSPTSPKPSPSKHSSVVYTLPITSSSFDPELQALFSHFESFKTKFKEEHAAAKQAAVVQQQQELVGGGSNVNAGLLEGFADRVKASWATLDEQFEIQRSEMLGMWKSELDLWVGVPQERTSGLEEASAQEAGSSMDQGESSGYQGGL